MLSAKVVVAMKKKKKDANRSQDFEQHEAEKKCQWEWPIMTFQTVTSLHNQKYDISSLKYSYKNPATIAVKV